MAKKQKAKMSKTTQKVLISISTLFLLAIIFFISYRFATGSTKSDYVDQIRAEITKIDDINKDAADSVNAIDKLKDDDKDGLNKIISSLSKAEAAMQKSINAVKEISPPSNYKKHHTAFLDALSLNKKIYSQTNLILKNTKSKELENAYNALKEYIKNTSAAYEASKLEKAYVKLPSGILTLWSNVEAYGKSAYAAYEGKAQLLEQYTKYYNSMDEIIEDFSNIKMDLNTYIDAISANRTTIGDVYIEVDKKLGELAELKNNYSGLTVPSKVAEQHTKLDEIIGKYITYCESFKPILTELEEAGTNQDALMEVSISLEELYVSLTEINVNYKEFKEQYDKNKDIYMNIDNL